jgi:WD40 repeat protein
VKIKYNIFFIFSCFSFSLFASSKEDAFPSFIIENPTKVISITFTFDDTRLITGGIDGIVRIWDWKNGLLINELVHTNVSHTAILSLNVSRDGNLLAALCKNHRINIWNIDTGDMIRSIIIPNMLNYDLYHDLKFLSDQSRIVFVNGGDLIIWDIVQDHESAVFRKFFRPPFTSIAVSPDDSMLVLGYGTGLGDYRDGGAIVWDIESKDQINDLKVQPYHPVSCVDYSANGCWILTSHIPVSGNAESRLWDVEEGKLIQKFIFDYKARLRFNSCFLANDNKILLVYQMVYGINDTSGLFAIYDIDIKEVQMEMKFHNSISVITLSHNKNYIATTLWGEEEKVRFFKLGISSSMGIGWKENR